MIELTFLRVLMLIRQAYQKISLFATIDNFKIKGLSFNGMSAMSIMMSMNLNNTAISNIHYVDYDCVIKQK